MLILPTIYFNTKIMRSCLLISALVLHSALHTTAQDIEFQYDTTSCTTPRGKIGTCIDIRDCSCLLRLLQMSRNNSTVMAYLRDSSCGYSQTGPMVCCPVGSNMPLVETKPHADLPSAEFKQCGNRTRNLKAQTTTESSEGEQTFHITVVGGQAAKQGDWPWLAALGYRGDPPSTDTKWLCGGALITSRHVLSAAHCLVRIGLYVVRLGEHDFGTDFDSAVDIEVKRIITHPEYNRRARVGDIGIIELKRIAPDNYAIHPICLPYSEDVANKNYITDIYQDFPWGAGWGSLEYDGRTSPVLQEVKIPVVSEDECRKAYANFPKQIIDKRVLCAGYQEGGKDVCSGDSGGPLMWPKRARSGNELDTTYYVIGIVAYGYRCAEPDYPGVYTRVSEFMPWIRSNIL